MYMRVFFYIFSFTNGIEAHGLYTEPVLGNEKKKGKKKDPI